MDFPLHDPDTAPEASRPLLEGAEQAYGFIPNLFRVMAESPSALQSYLAIGQALEQSALSPIEQQVAFLAVSGENGCDYCVGAHAAIAGMVEMPAAVIEALRARQPLPDERLEAAPAGRPTPAEQGGSSGYSSVTQPCEASFTHLMNLCSVPRVAL